MKKRLTSAPASPSPPVVLARRNLGAPAPPPNLHPQNLCCRTQWRVGKMGIAVGGLGLGAAQQAPDDGRLTPCETRYEA